jgi:hypothetical protein
MLTTGYTEPHTSKRFGAAAERLRAELASADFGLLCEIDVQQTLVQSSRRAGAVPNPRRLRPTARTPGADLKGANIGVGCP